MSLVENHLNSHYLSALECIQFERSIHKHFSHRGSKCQHEGLMSTFKCSKLNTSTMVDSINLSMNVTKTCSVALPNFKTSTFLVEKL